MEMFEVFGFADKVLAEAYWVNETVFWKPDRQNTAVIVRQGRVQDVEEGLSEMPHVHPQSSPYTTSTLISCAAPPSRLEPHYGRVLTELDIDTDPLTRYP